MSLSSRLSLSPSHDLAGIVGALSQPERPDPDPTTPPAPRVEPPAEEDAAPATGIARLLVGGPTGLGTSAARALVPPFGATEIAGLPDTPNAADDAGRSQEAVTDPGRQPPPMIVTTPKYLLSGTTVSMGEPACSTTARVNPAYPTIYEDNAAWVAEFLPFRGREDRTRALECRYPMWDCLCYPGGIAKRVLHSSCLTSLMFDVDDMAIVAHAVFDKVSTFPATGHPYGPAFADLYATFKRDMPPRVFRRFRRAWQDWFRAVLEENHYRKAMQTPGLAEYLRLRRTAVGLLPYIVEIEYSMGLDLTDALEADPDLVSMGDMAVDHATFVNDLCSFRTEMFDGDVFSIVALLLRTHAGSLQNAVDTTIEMIRDADRSLADISSRLRERNHDPAVRAYIDAVNAFCAGNLRWSLETTRYIGRANVWNGLRSGNVTMDADRTTRWSAETSN